MFPRFAIIFHLNCNVIFHVHLCRSTEGKCKRKRIESSAANQRPNKPQIGRLLRTQPRRREGRFLPSGSIWCLPFITLPFHFHLPPQLRGSRHNCVYFSKCWQASISNLCPAFWGLTWISKPSPSHVWIFILLLPCADTL